MLRSMGSQRVGRDLVTEQQQQQTVLQMVFQEKATVAKIKDGAALFLWSS